MSDLAPGGETRDVDFAGALGERYLSYALSTIMARSLPDVRDGLKPVHRRILHAMQQLRLDPASGYKKCARVVGDVIGKFHPHGEVAVYEALVRLAQDFSQRYPLVDGQGNFGNIDGDNAAAMRYTESRLSAVAQAMLDGIGEEAVDFRQPYDGDDREPVVLPPRFPKLLADGGGGIALRTATSIPPHDVGALCTALLVLMEQLFRLTELETRVPLNLNVVDALGVPRVMNLKEALQAFLDHRREVLQRRSRHRLAAVARRMEILRGFIVVYVNLDQVIRIIRRADDPKAEIMKRWDLSEVQADAILNMRLRTLHRLEEVAITKEMASLGAESAELEKLLGSERRQWTVLAKEIAATQKEFGGDTELGRRRTLIGAAPAAVEIPAAALVEREPVTVLL